MTFRHVMVALCFASAFLSSQSHAGSRGLRADAPGKDCFNEAWYPILNDPYAIFNGNLDQLWDSENFFNPGTVVTPPGAICLSADIYAVGSYSSSGDSPNPASQPQFNPNPPAMCPGPGSGFGDGCGEGPTNAALTATGAVMYEWINPTDPNLTPDAEVIVWNLPPSALFPIGALEFEFDNWCSANDGGVGTAPSPSAVPSFYFNGNHFTYYLTCADFNGYDLLISPTGVLLGYVDLNNNTYATNTVAGWQVGYNTTTRLALSTNTAPAGTCVIFKANVSELPGAPQPVGLVTFFNGTTALATEKMDAVGSASFATADLAPGTYSIQASFHRQDTHDASYAGSSVSAHQSLKVTSPSKSVPCN